MNFLKLMRPKQWTKNILIFAGIIFSKHFGNINELYIVTIGFILFCLASSVIYILNDIIDHKKDALHPIKKNRPIASGKISINKAVIFLIILFCILTILSYLLNKVFFMTVLSYISIMILYSFKLKKIVILDVMIISVGFVIRAIAGTFLINVDISPWLILCTFQLALLIGFGKRHSEIKVLGEIAHNHRKNLKKYSLKILDYYILILSATVLLSYSLYTISSRTTGNIHSGNFIYTIPFVVYGLFRYIYILLEKNICGEPELLLFKDKHILMSVILWLITILSILIQK